MSINSFLLKSECILALTFSQVCADEQTPTSPQPDIYDAKFFEQFSPQTVLENIQNIPGSMLNTVDKVSGFDMGAGNMLTDGNYRRIKVSAFHRQNW